MSIYIMVISHTGGLKWQFKNLITQKYLKGVVIVKNRKVPNVVTDCLVRFVILIT